MAYKIASITSFSPSSLSRLFIRLDRVRPLRSFCVLYCFWSFGRSVGRSSATAASSPYVLILPVWSLHILPALLCCSFSPTTEPCEEKRYAVVLRRAPWQSISPRARARIVNVFMWTGSQLWNGQKTNKILAARTSLSI